jgi:ABC-2 type transport system permease protein
LLFAALISLNNAAPTAKLFPESQQAQQEFAGTAQMYIKELWNLPIATHNTFLVYFIEVTFVQFVLCSY